MEEETVIREHTRKKKATHDDLFKGLRVEKVVIPLPEEEQVCPVCGTQMVLIGEEYVRGELEFVPTTCLKSLSANPLLMILIPLWQISIN